MRHLPHHHILVVDLPGHGKSTAPAHQSFEALQLAIKSFLLDQQVHKVVIIGYSMGAVLALSFACSYPKQVCGLFLLACGSRFNIPLGWFTTLLNSESKKLFFEQFGQIVFAPSFSHIRGKNCSRQWSFSAPQPY